MDIFVTMGNVIVAIGLAFMLFGVIGLYRFNRFYEKALVASKIDTVGTITIIFGTMLIHGAGLFSARLLVLLGIVFLLSPLSTHIVARSAYKCEGAESVKV